MTEKKITIKKTESERERKREREREIWRKKERQDHEKNPFPEKGMGDVLFAPFLPFPPPTMVQNH